MITEEEVIRAVLDRHSPSSAEKFIQEVFWRTYWKGWLELRPTVLTRFNEERIALNTQIASDAALAARIERAKAGETGIACFDAWTKELLQFGYLHNHTRMWYASIWIFTLELPWQIGSDFFFKHLLDADPASNTLSWRWVAGLQTKGKHYLARAANIREYTNGRFDPRGELNERAAPLRDDEPSIRAGALAPGEPLPDEPVALLLTEEDLHPESWDATLDVRTVAALSSPPLLPDASRPAAGFSEGALHDALRRASAHFNAPSSEVIAAGDLARWARGASAATIATGYPPTGLIAWELSAIEPALQAQGLRLARYRRAWDTRAWPFAKSGFFGFKEHIPSFIERLSSSGQART
jgi:deoxyribodipyrimidine photo-lyase